MTYEEARESLSALHPFTIKPSLDRIQAVLESLGNPQDRMRIIHVAGTNGKGSVAAMVASILEAGGYRTGLYTSPHLCSIRERVRINRAPISENAFAEGVSRLLPQIQNVGLTYFETLTALGFNYFAEQGVEWAVLEVGMGGRWDATTVGHPLVSIITPVDLDHQAYLGWRLEEIAREKAAVIRNGRRSVAISAAQSSSVQAILEARAAEVGVQLLTEGKELHFSIRQQDLNGYRLDLRGPDWGLAGLALPLLGSFQPQNCLLAVGAVQSLAGHGARLSEEAIRSGLSSVRWPGRFQLLRQDPWLIVDSAHNPAGARALANSLQAYFPQSRITLVLGIYKDKDKAQILETLAPLAARIILTSSSSPRASSPQELQALLPDVKADIFTFPTVSESLSYALALPFADVTCVAGSLSLVAEAIEWSRGWGGDIPCEI
jgi:dihydrofolate synthase/folylpolyglutamate synthase